MATKTTQKLEKQRNSNEMQEFKSKVNEMLEFVNRPEIEYYMIRDLSRKMNLPFYKETKNRGIRTKMSADEVIKGYCEICRVYYIKDCNGDFIKKLFKHLSEQQNQYFRKLSRRTSKSVKTKGENGVWEHPIPLKYSTELLVGYIISDNKDKINKYIDFIWSNTYQVFLRKELDDKLRESGLRDIMPKGWNWEDPANNNVFQRYIEAEISEEEYRF